MDCRPEIELHLVEYRPGWKVGCGWGVMFRDGRPVLAKILLPKSRVGPLQQEISQGRYPMEPVSRWQFRLVVDDVGGLLAAYLGNQEGGAM